MITAGPRGRYVVSHRQHCRGAGLCVTGRGADGRCRRQVSRLRRPLAVLLSKPRPTEKMFSQWSGRHAPQQYHADFLRCERYGDGGDGERPLGRCDDRGRIRRHQRPAIPRPIPAPSAPNSSGKHRYWSRNRIGSSICGLTIRSRKRLSFVSKPNSATAWRRSSCNSTPWTVPTMKPPNWR